MEKKYWSSFYNSHIIDTLPPSQFAAFVQMELNSSDHKEFVIIDYGCGSGRDSKFFKNYHSHVLSVDQVKHSIFEDSNLEISFALPDELEFLLDASDVRDKVKCFYMRFFLHAISEKEQQLFFERLKKLCSNGDWACFEFRTDEDATLDKETAAHYRRYQSADAVMQQLVSFGFKVEYCVQGRGFAKYGKDDAHVARIIAKYVL